MRNVTKTIVKTEFFVLTGFLILIFIVNTAIAQDIIINPGGTYAGSGTLKMRGGSLANQHGTITGIGSTSFTRVSGTVEWSKNVLGQTQNVQSLYYSSLKMSGKDKSILDGIYVSGTYTISGHLGNRNYNTGTFHYDYSNSAGGLQPITADNYYNLDLFNAGAKSQSSGSLTMTNQFTQSGGQFSIANTSNFELGSANSSQSSGNITNLGTFKTGNNPGAVFTISSTGSLNNGFGTDDGIFIVRQGTMNLNGPLVQAVSTSSFSLLNGSNLNSAINGTIALNNGSFFINSGGTATLNKSVSNTGIIALLSGGIMSLGSEDFTNNGNVSVGGALTLNSPSSFLLQGGSLTGDFAGSSGTMTFNNALAISGSGQLILGTGDLLSIAGAFTRTDGQNLAFNDASKFYYTGSTAQTILSNGTNFLNYGNLFLINAGAKSIPNSAGNLRVNGNLSLSGTNLEMNNNTIIVAGTANYADAEEVIGRFERESANLNTTNTFTFNNRFTNIRFANTVPTNFTINDQPFGSPNYGSGPNLSSFSSLIDVQRKITVSFLLSGISQLSYLQMGYKPSDIVGLTIPESNLRYVEGNGSARGEKLTMESVLKQNLTTGFLHYVLLDNTYAGADPANNILLTLSGNGFNNFETGNDLVLSGADYPILTLRDGRWSDPGTWDEGVVPNATQDISLRHVVYTGLDQTVYGMTSYSGDEVDGSVLAAAHSITIASPLGTKGSALIIGNRDATILSSRLFRTVLTGAGTGIFVTNTNTSTESEANIENFTLIPGNVINGLWILGTVDPSHNNFMPWLAASSLTNSGQIINNGILELGE